MTAPTGEYTTYPRRFAAYRWFKPLLVGALTVVFAAAAVIAVNAVGVLWLGADGFAAAVDPTSRAFYEGPGALLYLARPAVLLPALAFAALIVRDRPLASYASSRGGWEWGMLAKCLALALVVCAVVTAIALAAAPDRSADGVNKLTFAGVVVLLLMVPLQAAAEEFAFRGLLMQSIGAWTTWPALALAASSCVFAVLHSYDAFGIAAVLVAGLAYAVVTWHSRGLEAAIALHTVNNLCTFLLQGLGLAGQAAGPESLVVALAANIAFCAALKMSKWADDLGGR